MEKWKRLYLNDSITVQLGIGTVGLFSEEH